MDEDRVVHCLVHDFMDEGWCLQVSLLAHLQDITDSLIEFNASKIVTEVGLMMMLKVRIEGNSKFFPYDPKKSPDEWKRAYESGLLVKTVRGSVCEFLVAYPPGAFPQAIQ
jgi:hypothetical protein